MWFMIGLEDQPSVDRRSGLPVLDANNLTMVTEGWGNLKMSEVIWWAEKRCRQPVKLNDSGECYTETSWIAPMWTRYITSMYTIFNGLDRETTTDNEKKFAIFSELIVSTLVFGLMAAMLTDAVMSSSAENRDFNNRYAGLKLWMRERGVQKSVQGKVLKFYSFKYKSNVTFDQDELLRELPPAMSATLMFSL